MGRKSLLVALLAILIWTSTCRNWTELSSVLLQLQGNCPKLQEPIRIDFPFHFLQMLQKNLISQLRLIYFSLGTDGTCSEFINNINKVRCWKCQNSQATSLFNHLYTWDRETCMILWSHRHPPCNIKWLLPAKRTIITIFPHQGKTKGQKAQRPVEEEVGPLYGSNHKVHNISYMVEMVDPCCSAAFDWKWASHEWGSPWFLFFMWKKKSLLIFIADHSLTWAEVLSCEDEAHLRCPC